jgi:hypothetical protein
MLEPLLHPPPLPLLELLLLPEHPLPPLHLHQHPHQHPHPLLLLRTPIPSVLHLLLARTALNAKLHLPLLDALLLPPLEPLETSLLMPLCHSINSLKLLTLSSLEINKVIESLETPSLKNSATKPSNSRLEPNKPRNNKANLITLFAL